MVQQDIWKVIDTYFKSNPYYFTRHHIDSYNDFVFNKIPYIVDNLNPFIVLKETLRVEVWIDAKSLVVKPPTYAKDDEDAPLYLNVARLEN